MMLRELDMQVFLNVKWAAYKEYLQQLPISFDSKEALTTKYIYSCAALFLPPSLRQCKLPKVNSSACMNWYEVAKYKSSGSL